MDFDILCSDITAETGEQDANWRDVIHWLMLRWNQNSGAAALLALALRVLLQEFILCKFILQEFTNEPIPTTIHINTAEPAPSKNFSHAKITHFLGLMLEEILPMGNEEMKLVASRHDEVCPPGRSALSLWRKFASLQRIKRMKSLIIGRSCSCHCCQTVRFGTMVGKVFVTQTQARGT